MGDKFSKNKDESKNNVENGKNSDKSSKIQKDKPNKDNEKEEYKRSNSFIDPRTVLDPDKNANVNSAVQSNNNDDVNPKNQQIRHTIQETSKIINQQKTVLNNNGLIIKAMEETHKIYNLGKKEFELMNYTQSLYYFELAIQKVLSVSDKITDEGQIAKKNLIIERLNISKKEVLQKIQGLNKPYSNPPEKLTQIYNSPHLANQKKKYVVKEIYQKNVNQESDLKAKNDTNAVKQHKNHGKNEVVTDDLYDRINNEILDTKLDVKFSDVVGLDQAKQILKEIIILPAIRPDLFTGLRSPPRGLLLFGPPGTGKTLIAKAVATECQCTFFSISASSLTSKYLGESEKLVRALFQIAAEKSPAVIFIDEIESILSKRTDGENDAVKRLKTEFLIQFDGVNSQTSSKLLVIGATNRPFDLDNAVIRRLPKKIYIGPFDLKERVQFLSQIMKSCPHQISDREFLEISKKCENYSNSDLKELCKEAAYEPIREYSDLNKLKNLTKLRNIVYNDFVKALKIVRGSLSKSIIDELELWNSKNGAIE